MPGRDHHLAVRGPLHGGGTAAGRLRGELADDLLDDILQCHQATHVTVLVDNQFDSLGFGRAIERRPYSIVHMASHGEFGSSAKDTFILTHDSRITLDQLEAQLGGTAYRQQPVELLALSACQTASGDDRAALGLGGVAVKAGARSALATLWSVSDRASTLLVGEFYQRLQDPNVNKAQALQAAQRRLLADARYRHPAYWSPFLLIGNWL